MRIISAVFLILLSVFCLTQYYSLGVANAHFFAVSEQLNNWAKHNKVESKEEYTNTLNSINYVLENDNQNPHYWHIKGKVVHWGIFAGFEDKAEFGNIKNYYITATELRKNWPMVWADLALVNSNLHGVNDETQGYINQALSYGPFEYEVLMALSEIYLANWQFISSEQKTLFFSSLVTLTKFGYRFESVFRLADNYGKKQLICNYVKYAKETSHLAEQGLFKRHCK